MTFRRILPKALLSAAVLLAAILITGAESTSQARQSRSTGDGAVAMEMRNVAYHFTSDVSVNIANLRGALLPAERGRIPVFDDKNSFMFRIDSAQVAMSVTSLANVLNSNVFNRKDAPLKDISIRAANGRLKIKGKLSSKGGLPFESEGVLSPTPDGKIRLHIEKVKAMHLPVKGLMDLLGLDIADLIKTNKVKGVQTEKDDLILDPQQILPPPHIQGRVTAVSVQGDDIVQIFGQPSQSPPRMPGNYMAYRGNQLRFGKLTMSDTDLVLVDMDARDPFDFYLDHYKEQLVAGYSKTTPSFGLRTYMRDFNKLKAPAGAAGSGSR